MKTFLTEQQIEILKQRPAAGQSYSAIACKYGLTREYVQGYFRQLNGMDPLTCHVVAERKLRTPKLRKRSTILGPFHSLVMARQARKRARASWTAGRYFTWPSLLNAGKPYQAADHFKEKIGERQGRRRVRYMAFLREQAARATLRENRERAAS